MEGPWESLPWLDQAGEEQDIVYPAFGLLPWPIGPQKITSQSPNPSFPSGVDVTAGRIYLDPWRFQGFFPFRDLIL